MTADPNAFDLGAVQTGLQSIVAGVSGLHTQWEDQPRDMIDPTTAAVVLLSMPAIVPVGYDERSTVNTLDDPPIVGSEFQYLYKGMRNITLTIKVESYDFTNGRTAMGLLELLRTKLYWASTGDALNALGMGYIDDEHPVNLGVTQDGHMVSTCALDCHLSYRFSIRDPNKFGWIETAELVPFVVDGLTIHPAP